MRIRKSVPEYSLLMRKCSDQIEKFPSLYNSIMKMRVGERMRSQRIVTNSTDLVIEGFCRSGNSFAVEAFYSANSQNTSLSIASHLHSPAPAILGLRKGIPVMVLIRNPDASIVSWLALSQQLGKSNFLSMNEHVLIKVINYWTYRYAQFYSRLYDCRGGLLVCQFEEVTSDFGQCMRRLNEKFATTFSIFEHTQESEKLIFDRSKLHLSPSHQREKLKEKLKEFYFSKANACDRSAALRIYEDFING